MATKMKPRYNNKIYQEELDEKKYANFELISDYIPSTKGKIKIKCRDCNGIFESTARQGLLRENCPFCSDIKRKVFRDYDHNQEKRDIKNMFYNLSNNEHYQLLEDYKTARHAVNILHKDCGHIFRMAPVTFCNNPRCMFCNQVRPYKMNTDMFNYRVNNETNGEYTVLGEYKAQNIPVKIKHNKCGKIYSVVPANFKKGTRCPFCAASSGEKEIMKILDYFKIDYIFQKSFDGLIGDSGRNLLYDFYIEKYNILIEFQGEFHDSKNNKAQKILNNFQKNEKYDSLKRAYAKNNNIKLIEIWYQDIKNISAILINEIGLTNLVGVEDNILIDKVINNKNYKKIYFILNALTNLEELAI